MFFIPIGLEVKRQKIPWLTIAIVFVTGFISYKNKDLTYKYTKHLLNNEEVQDYLKSAKKYINEDCDSKLSVSTCNSNKNISNIMLIFSDGIKSHKKRKVESYLNKFSLSQLKEKNKTLYEKKLALNSAKVNYAKQNNILMKGSVTFTSSLKSIFLHGGYIHFLSNILILIVLLPFLEMRLGAFYSLILYLGSGVLGAASYTYFFMSPHTILVGASTAIYGLFGAYMIFFNKNYFKVWVSYLGLINNKIFFKVLFFIPAFVLIKDLAEAFHQASNVAHIAHILSFCSGLALGYILKLCDPLNEKLSFPFEKEYLKKSILSTDLYGADISHEWIIKSPSNYLAFQLLCSKKDLELEKFQESISKSIEFHKTKSDYYGLFPTKFIDKVKLDIDPKVLIGAYKTSEKISVKTKISYFIAKSLSWKDSSWNEKFLGCAHASGFYPKLLKKNMIPDFLLDEENTAQRMGA